MAQNLNIENLSFAAVSPLNDLRLFGTEDHVCSPFFYFLFTKITKTF